MYETLDPIWNEVFEFEGRCCPIVALAPCTHRAEQTRAYGGARRACRGAETCPSAVAAASQLRRSRP
eukprot:scaffold182405_cov29-Tisochrysis_lutea.AAC.7